MPQRQIKIDSELSWLAPYMKPVKRIVPLDRIKHLKVNRFDKRVNRGNYAMCTKHGKMYTIKIDKYYQRYTHHHDGSWSVKLFPHSKIDMLCLLAHELAHAALWSHDHSPDHKLLEARITSIFMRQLKRENYKDEEDELKTKGKDVI